MRFEFYEGVRFCIAVLVLSGLLAGVPVLAQEAITAQVVQVDSSRFPEVDVYVSVVDSAGQPVKNLGAGDFELYEEGQPVALAHVSRAGEQGPVTAVLLIDKSGSMAYAGKMEAAREAAIAFVELMRPGDVTGVIAFNTQVTTAHSLSEDSASLVEAIRSIEAVDDTALYDALHAAAAMLEPVGGRKAVIAVTDGMNTAGMRTRAETLALVAEQGISVYTVGLGDPSQGTATYAGIDEETLQEVAETSGGIYTFAPNPEELRGLYELLSLRIQNEYRLTYRSPNQLRDGTNRTVAVTVIAPSGPAEVTATYNPGGVIPEVEARPTWGLFVPILAVLILLLFLPGVIGRIGLLRSARGSQPAQAKGRVKLRTGASREGAAKGRIRLTKSPRSSGKRRE
jgi:VWFA-related protein